MVFPPQNTDSLLLIIIKKKEKKKRKDREDNRYNKWKFDASCLSNSAETIQIKFFFIFIFKNSTCKFATESAMATIEYLLCYGLRFITENKVEKLAFFFYLKMAGIFFFLNYISQ